MTFSRFIHLAGCGIILMIGMIGCDTSTDSSDNPLQDDQHSGPYVVDLDSWDEEVYQDRTAVQLGHISQWLKRFGDHAPDPQDATTDEVAGVLKDQLTVTPLRPESENGETVYDQQGMRIVRWSTQAGEGRGVDRDGFIAALKTIQATWPQDAAAPYVKLKQFSIQPNGEKVVTKAHFSAHARGKNTAVQQTGTWICEWDYIPDGKGTPRLRSVVLENLDEVRANLRGGQPLLVDVTAKLIGSLPSYQNQLRYGANYWITRLPQLKHRFHHGASVGDLNGDGLEDVYICEPEGLPNLLFLRQPDGTVREAAAEFGLNWLDYSRSSLMVDLDNDGDQDFVLAGWNSLSIFENNAGRFERRMQIPGRGQLTSICAADFDRDGRLDIYTCRYSGETLDGRPVDPIPHHDAVNGGSNALLANRGGFKFEDVTKQVGLSHNNTRWSFAASWEDYDNDGDLDLYVANDYGRNNLYQQQVDANGKITFQDVAASAGVEDQSFGMSVAWGDPNRDGRFDVHVSNMFSSAGQRVTFQRNFKRSVSDVDEEHIKAVQYGAMGNSVFQNRGDGQFDYVSQQAGVARGLWAWSSPLLDLNNDGWEDILVANGFITGPSNSKDL